MNRLFCILTILFVVGCSSTGKTVEPTPPSVDAPSGSVTCAHKYDGTRNFIYVLPINKSTMTLFGEVVTTYEFTLLDGTPRFLSGDEESNYDCNLVD